MSVFLTPKCPKDNEQDSNKLWFADILAGFGPVHDSGEEIEQQRIQKLFDHTKANWADCINLINKMSKVTTNNQSINSFSKV